MADRSRTDVTTTRGEGQSVGSTTNQNGTSKQTRAPVTSESTEERTQNNPKEKSTQTRGASTSKETRPEIITRNVTKPGGASVQSSAEDFGCIITFTVPIRGGLGLTDCS